MSTFLREDVEIAGFKEEETLEKFRLGKLDMHRIDRNVELYTLDDLVDMIVFLRKVQRPEGSSLQ